MRTLIGHILIIILIFPFCNDRAHKERSFQSYIPDTTTSKYNLPKAALNLCHELNLNRIDKGVESFEFRLWFSGVSDIATVYIIKNVDNTWFTTSTDYWTRLPNIGEKGYTGQKYPYRGVHAIVDSSRTYRILPLIAYSTFVDSLKYFDLNNIPSQKGISGFKDGVMDGLTYSIELSTNKYYKLLSYHSPGLQNDKFGYNLKIVRLLKFLERVFGVDFYIG